MTKWQFFQLVLDNMIKLFYILEINGACVKGTLLKKLQHGNSFYASFMIIYKLL